jgi:tetratricopeptide (TPR) repeat protein
MQRSYKAFSAALLAASMVPWNAVIAQDLVPVSDISGGSSVFVFRSSSKAAPQKFVSRTRATRSKEEKRASTVKITRQYEELASVTPRRSREKVVDPHNLPDAVRLKTMPKEEAAKLFAGVGEFYIDKNDSENAINFFREAVALDRNNPIAPKGLSEGLSLKGNELLVKDQTKAAKDLFDEALKYNPNNAVAFYGIAEVFSEQGADSDAIANYEKALGFDKDLTEIYVPLGILYYQAGNIAKADELLTKAIAIDPSSAETQFFLGLVRYAQNNNAAALTAFNKATTAKPIYPEAFYYTGETLDRMDKKVEAAAAYKTALDQKPKYFEAALDLGSEYYKLDRWPDAIDAYEKAVKLKNDNIQAYINLGDAYRQIGNFEKAEANYNLAVSFFERDPSYSKVDAADTYNKIGFVIAQQCPKNVAKALPCRWDTATRSLEKAAALTNDNVDYANLGWAYYNAAKRDLAENKSATGREKLEKARTNLQRVTNANTQYLTAPMVNLGMALNDLGDYPSAIKVLGQVVQREPKWVFAINELGSAYYGNKDYKSAIDRFNTAVKRDDKFAIGWFNLGKAQYANGNVGEAKKAYGQLRKIGANNLADRLDRETGGAMART